MAHAQRARRRRSASGYERQIATSGPPPVSRWLAGGTFPLLADLMEDLMEEISVLEPLEHSVLEVSLEGGDSSIVEVACSEVVSVLEP